MAIVQVLRNGQITLPIEIRRALNLKRGSFLDIKLKGKAVLLVPQTVTDEEGLKRKVSEVINRVRAKNKNIPPEEIEEDIAAAVKAVRAKKQDEATC